MKETIVIVGTGWAGYTLAHALDDKKFDIVVISPESTSPYTPLLASAACGLFNVSLAEEPIRRKSKALRYVKAYVDNIDFEMKICICRPAFDKLASQTFNVSYDYIVIAPGCGTQTFGTPGVSENAIFVKNVADAVKIQQRLQEILEIASLPTTSDEEQRKLLHIIVVGGGPTGVEISAEMYDLVEHDLLRLYPEIASKITIAIHDVATQILSVFDSKLSEYALQSFAGRNVDIKTGSHIIKVEQDVMHTKEDGEIPYGMLIWATGNKQVPLVDTLNVAKSSGLRRILTNDHLQVLSQSGSVIIAAYALGDAADVQGGALPTTAEVACQKGDYIANVFNKGKAGPFAYQQRAVIAYLGQHDGVVSGTRDWSGPGAWFAWRSKNLTWARSWRNKVLITTNWGLNYVFGKEVARS